MQALVSFPVRMSTSGDLRARVLAAAASRPSPTRGQVRARNLALLVSGIVVPLIVFHSWGGMRPGGTNGDQSMLRPDALILETAGGAASIALVVAIVALRRGRSMLGRTGSALLAVAVLTPVALFAWKYFVSAAYPGMTVEWPARIGLRCLRLSCMTAAWPLAAFVMTRSGSDPTHPRLTGAAIGAAIGAATWVFVDLWCPVAYVPHLLLGHLLPLLLTTLVGWWLGGAVIALRKE